MLPEISRRCLACGASVRAGARYCPQCGTRFAAGGEDEAPAAERGDGRMTAGADAGAAERPAPAAAPPTRTAPAWADDEDPLDLGQTRENVAPTRETVAPTRETFAPAPPPAEVAPRPAEPGPLAAGARVTTEDAFPAFGPGAPHEDSGRGDPPGAAPAPATEGAAAGRRRTAARVKETVMPRVERMRDEARVVLEETPDDSGLRFVVIAVALFALFILFLLLSTTVLR